MTHGHTEKGSSQMHGVDLLACNVVSWTFGSYDSETSWSDGDAFR